MATHWSYLQPAVRGQEAHPRPGCCLGVWHQVCIVRERKYMYFFPKKYLIIKWPLISPNLPRVRKCEVSLVYSLPRKSSLSSDSNKTFCMLGHCTQTSGELVRQARSWSMGTVLLFNGRTFTFCPAGRKRLQHLLSHSYTIFLDMTYVITILTMLIFWASEMALIGTPSYHFCSAKGNLWTQLMSWWNKWIVIVLIILNKPLCCLCFRIQNRNRGGALSVHQWAWPDINYALQIRQTQWNFHQVCDWRLPEGWARTRAFHKEQRCGHSSSGCKSGL